MAALGGKLKLKRRRPPPPAENLLLPPPRPPPHALAKDRCWFEEQDLNEAERTWIMLLKSVDPNLNCSSFEKDIKLPAFVTETSSAAAHTSDPETFQAGLKLFQWVPFPLYHRQDIAARDAGFQHGENGTAALGEREDVGSGRSGVVCPASDEKPQTTNKLVVTEMRERCNIEHSLKLEGREAINQYQDIDPQNSSTCTSSEASAQFCPQRFDFQKFGQGPIPQHGKENWASDGAPVQQSTVFTEATSELRAANPSPSGSVVEVQGKTASHKEEISALDCCPMCQMPFTGAWSELDVDSHLAKCLSESAEDMMW